MSELPCKFIVGAAAQHELDFVVRAEYLKVLHAKRIAFAGIRALHIDNLDDIGRNPLQWPLSAGLKQNLVTIVQKALHQGNDFPLLQHRLAASDLDQATARTKPRDLVEHLFDGHFLATLERVLTLAPRATQVAPRQTHEDARQARISRFALQGFVDLSNLHSSAAV